MVASTPAPAELLKREVGQARAWGARVELVDAATASRLMPMLRAEKLLAIAHVPDNLYIDEPKQLLDAYLRAAGRAGVDVLPHTIVTGIHVEHGQTRGVVTSRGEPTQRSWSMRRVLGARSRRTGRGVSPCRVAASSAVHHGCDRWDGTAISDHSIRRCRLRVSRAPGHHGGGVRSGPVAARRRASRRVFNGAHTPRFLGPGQIARDHRRVCPAVKDATVREHRGGLFTITANWHFIAGRNPTSGVCGW